jgi:hypothetical protein
MSLLHGSITFTTFKRGRVSKPESSGLLRGILEMSNRWVRAYRSCESIMVRVNRVYFKKRGRALIILLAGGDKSTQARDIKAALRLARNLSESSS